MSENRKKLTPELLQSEYGLSKEEITPLALLAIVPFVTPTVFVESEREFNRISNKDFGSQLAALIGDSHIAVNESSNLFFRRDLRNSIADSVEDEIFLKQVEYTIQLFSNIPRTRTITEDAILGYCKALKSLIESSRQVVLVNFSNSDLIRRLDATIIKEEDCEHSVYSEYIDKDSWMFLKYILEHPYLSLEE